MLHWARHSQQKQKTDRCRYCVWCENAFSVAFSRNHVLLLLIPFTCFFCHISFLHKQKFDNSMWKSKGWGVGNNSALTWGEEGGGKVTPLSQKNSITFYVKDRLRFHFFK